MVIDGEDPEVVWVELQLEKTISDKTANRKNKFFKLYTLMNDK